MVRDVPEHPGRPFLLARSALLAFALLALPACGEPGRQAPSAATTRGEAMLTGRVERVFDGDSFTMRLADGSVTGVRIAGIDAPERTQAFAGVSRRALSAMLEHKDVQVGYRKRDPFERIVGPVFSAGRDVGLAQIEAGLAWHFRRYAHEQPAEERSAHEQAESRARKARRGLWADDQPTPPWEFRAGQRRSRQR